MKWAQSSNAAIANKDYSRVLISGPFTNRLVHRWRSEEAAILVGTNTALNDDPALDARLWTGPAPVRLVVDLHLRLPHHLQIFDGKQKTVILNGVKNEETLEVTYHKIDTSLPLAKAIAAACHQLKIQSVLVEGGAQLLQAFIDEKIWDEARIIHNPALVIEQGLPAPQLLHHRLIRQEKISTDILSYYIPVP